MTFPQSNEPWTIDKKIPLALIGALLFRAAVLIIFITNLNNDVNGLKTNYDKLERRVANQEEYRISSDRQMVRLEEQMKTNTDLLQKIWLRMEQAKVRE